MCRYLLIAFLLLNLNACALLQDEPLSVWLSNTKKFYLLPSWDSDKKRTVIKKMRIEYQQQTYVLQIYLEMDKGKMILLGLSPLGGKVFSITYDGQEMLASSSELLKMKFKPEYLLADMQLIYWPDDKVIAGLTQQGFSLVKLTPQQRDIYRADKKLIEIAYSNSQVEDESRLWSSDIVFKNLLRGYEYHISNH